MAKEFKIHWGIVIPVITLAGVTTFIIVNRIQKKKMYADILDQLNKGTGQTGTVTDYKTSDIFGSVKISNGGVKTIQKTSASVQAGIKEIYDAVTQYNPLMPGVSKLMTDENKVLAIVKKYAQSQEQFSQLSSAFFAKYNKPMYDWLNNDPAALQLTVDYIKTLPRFIKAS